MDSKLIEICINLMTDEFLQLKTVEEKVIHFLETEEFAQFCNDFEDMTNEYHLRHSKSLRTGMQYLDEGNSHYNKRDYELAINLFSKAILNIPVLSDSDKNDLSLAYSLRSNAYYKLKKYSSALFDANCALDLVQTIGMKVRKIHCFVHLDKQLEAIQVIKQLLESHNISEENKSLISHLKCLKQRISDPSFAQNNSKICVESEDITDLYINQSVDTFISSVKGRGFMAKEDIKSKCLVLSEPLFVSVLNQESLRTHCNECLKRVDNQFIACNDCNEVVFCGKECLNKSIANRCHQKECTISGLLRRFGNYSHLVYKIIARIGVKTAIDLYNGCDISEEQTDVFTEKYRQFLLFHDHSQYRSETSEVSDVVIAVQLCLFLYYMKVYELDVIQPKQHFVKLCLLIIKNIHKVLINYFGIFENFKSERIGDIMVINGTLFNHSCSPNIIWIFKNQRLNFKTLEDIKSGEELTITYGPVYRVNPLMERQKLLKTKYHFVCNCFVCLEDSKSELTLHCSHCNDGPVLCPDIESPINWCLNCGQSCENRREVLKEIEECLTSLKTVLSELEIKDNIDCNCDEKSLQSAIDSMNSLSKLVYKESLGLNSYKKRLSRLCFSFNKFKKALDYSHEVMSNLENRKQFDYCLEMVFFSQTYYEILKEKKSKDKTEWKACLHMNQKICDLLKQFQKEYKESVEDTNETIVLIDRIIALKESIVCRMETHFSKLGLI